MNHPKRPYGNNNVFTFGHEWRASVLESQLRRSVGDPIGYEQFDLGIVEINDMGDFEDSSQLDAICQRIRDVRQHNSSGAIVVSFIHGWHNNADWDNANLASFLRLLKALMCRETEFLQRRVIGVYMGWNGDPTDGLGGWLSRIPKVKHCTFRDRYSAAGDIGKGDALSCSLVHLTTACKEAINVSNPEAPLVMVGHSMGAFILQSAFRELLRNPARPLVMSAGSGNTTVTIANNASPAVTMPDLLLSLNSAAEAEVAIDIIEMMKRDGWEKRFDPSSAKISVAPYNPPLLISTTSSQDSATNWIWRAGHFFQKSSTDGHDPTLATHTLVKSFALADCAPASTNDFGQPWHCLHKDVAPDPTPRFRIDLPDHDRSTGETLTHTAYDLIPKHPATASPFWLFQIPGEVVADHSDIFNYRAASFVLALIQASAVLASAGSEGWASNFSEIPLG